MRIILTIAWALLVFEAGAQNYEKRPWMPLENRIGLAVGIGSVQYLDKNTTPLVYKSQPKNVRIFYNLESNHFLFALDLDVRMGSTAPKHLPARMLHFEEEDYHGKKEDKVFPAGGSFLAGRISAGMFYKISSTQESTFKVAVGGRVTNELFYPQGWTSGGLFNALSVSPEAWTQHWIDKHHSFTATVRLPVAARVTRLPYDNTVSFPERNQGKGFFRNSAWKGPADFLAPAFSVGYNYQLNNRWGAGIHYDWSWYSIADPQRFRAVSQSLLANFYHQL